MISVKKVQKLFRVDSPGKHALLDGPVPVWVDDSPDWESHLEGSQALCVTPIGYNNTCYFGAMDIDSKGDAPSVKHEALNMFIKEHGLPLNLYFSRSGKGAHAYIFSSSPVQASEMRITLRLYSTLITQLLDQRNDIEIFPKQNELLPGDNGSCIRPPYFGKKCQPVFVGDPIVTQLLTLPQCLNSLPEEGDRNNFVYHMTNFLVLSGANNVKKLIGILNSNIQSPLTDIEIDRTVASAQRQRQRKGSGFGLGCSHCPDSRKDKCKFSSQVKIKETGENVTVEIVHYIAEDPKIRMTVDEKSLIFSMDDAFNNHKVRIDFIAKHRIAAIPMMKKGDWNKMLHEILETAEHVDLITHRDRGHFILQQLKKWSRDFKTGMSNLYSGVPTFISEKEVMLFSHDVYNRFISIGVQGISREDVNTTLESIGTFVTIDGNPVVKIPSEILGTNAPGMEIPIINDMAEDEVEIDCGRDGRVIFKDKNGAQIELTNTYIREHPELQKKILEKTKTSVDVQF